eukprot:c11291_g1_i1.p1 GENE.c11291_g1_i1~~c11291_g1_i1.p1  ORF type:complete len:306 (-),score=65.38 c11291_g1_i1:71-964(-)
MTQIAHLDPLTEQQVEAMYILTGIYSVLLILLILSFRKINSKSSLVFQKKLYHQLLILTVCCRIPFFSYRPSAEKTHLNLVIFVTLTRLSWFFFLLTFSLFLLLWIQLYHQAYSDSVSLPSSPRDGIWRSLFITIFLTTMISSVVVGFIFQILESDSQTLESDSLSQVFADSVLAILNLFVGFGFLWYGSRLFVLLRRVFIASLRRSRLIRRITAVTCVCTLCFLVRSSILFNETYCGYETCSYTDYFSGQMTFYSLGEVFPILSMMALTRMHSQLKTKQNTLAVQLNDRSQSGGIE